MSFACQRDTQLQYEVKLAVKLGKQTHCFTQHTKLFHGKKGVRMFVRQSRPSCRQEKLSTICLQVVYKSSTNKYLRYYLQIESCQTVPAFDLLVHSLVEVTCNPFNDVLTMIASVSMNTCHLLSVCRSLAIRKQTHCQT